MRLTRLGPGAIIRPRRPVDVPRNISGLVLYHDANDPDTFESPTGLSYSVADLCFTYDATCQTGRPVGLRADPYTGRRMARVEGGDNSSAGGYLPLNASFADVLESACELWFVGSFPGIASETFFAAGSTTDNDPVVQISNQGGVYRTFVRNTANTVSSSASSSQEVSTKKAIYRYKWSGSTVTLERILPGESSFTTLTTGSFNSTLALNTATLGALVRAAVTASGDLTFSKVLGFNTNLSDGDRDALRDSLIATELPAVEDDYGMPSQFDENAPPKLAVFTFDGSTTYGCTYSEQFSDYNDPVGSYFVRDSNGDDGDAGDAANPLKTMNVALAKTDLRLVDVGDELYAGTNWANSYTRPERPVIIRGPRGVGEWATFCNALEATWGDTAGQPNVDEFTTGSTVLEVMDRTNRYDADDADNPNRMIPYTNVASVALCNSTPGSWIQTGGKIHVHTHDSRQADRDVVCRIGSITTRLPYSTAGHFISMIGNIEFYNVTFGEEVTGCNSYYGSQAFYDLTEFEWDDTVETYLANTIFVHALSTDDILNYTLDAKVVEIGVRSINAGSADANNCSTGHNSAKIFRVNGYYSDAPRPINDIDDCQVLMLGCTVKDGETGGSNTNVLVQSGVPGGTDATIIVLDGGTYTNGTTHFQANDGCFIYCYNINPSGKTVVEVGTGQVIFDWPVSNNRPRVQNLNGQGYVSGRVLSLGGISIR